MSATFFSKDNQYNSAIIQRANSYRKNPQCFYVVESFSWFCGTQIKTLFRFWIRYLVRYGNNLLQKPL